MSCKKLTGAIAIAAIATAAAQAAAAQQSPPMQVYAIASAGGTYWNGDGTDLICDLNEDCDKLDSAARLVLGYQYSPGLAAELVFSEYGAFTARTGGFNARVRADAVGLGVAVWADLPPRWSGTVRLGLASVDGRASNNLNETASDSSLQLYAGFGLGYRLMPTLWMDTSWDLSQVRVDEADIKDTVHAVTVGVRLTF